VRLIDELSSSVKVVRPDVRGADGERRDVQSLHRDHVVLILEWAYDLKKLPIANESTLSFIEVGMNDDVGDSCFVLNTGQFFTGGDCALSEA